MPFQGFLYAGDAYLGLISANTMPAMKREASRFAISISLQLTSSC